MLLTISKPLAEPLMPITWTMFDGALMSCFLNFSFVDFDFFVRKMLETDEV